MSVNRTDYVIIGTNLINELNDLKEHSINYDEEYDKIIKALDNQYLDHVYDDLDGKYFIVGKIIKKCNYDGIPFTEFNFNQCEKIREIVKEKIKSVFNKDINSRLLIFSHWH